jgi:hypothetical protein
LHRPSEKKLKDILQLNAETVGVKIDSFFSSSELGIILNEPSIRDVLNKAADYFRYKVKNVPLPELDKPRQEQEIGETVQEKLQRLENEFVKLQQLSNSKLQEEARNSETVQQRLQRLEINFNQMQNLVINLTEEVKTLSIKIDRPIGEIITPPHPVILYLQEQKDLFEQEFTKPKIISDSDDIGKLKTIAEAFKSFKDFEIKSLRLGGKKLPEHIWIENENQSSVVGFLEVSGNSFTARIQNWNELLVRHEEISFELFRDRRQPEITGKVAKEEIKKLENADNGNFVIMEKEDRINFELIYKLITDIQNRDVKFKIEEALLELIDYLDNYWLINLFDEF